MKNIGFLFYATNEWGMGHLYRNISLMKKLCFEHNVIAITNRFEASLELLNLNCLDYKEVVFDNVDSIYQCLQGLELDVLVVDKLDNTYEEIQLYKKVVKRVISLDDQGAGAECVDVLVNAIVPLPKKIPQQVFSGPEYMIFKDEIEVLAKQNKTISEQVKNVMVCFGGSDPKKITERIIPHLKKLKEIKFDVVLGPGYEQPEKVIEEYRDFENIKVHFNLPSLGALIQQADICIISGGITLFECLYIGTPSIIICQVPHQVITADKYQKEGCVQNLGLVDELKIERFVYQFIDLVDKKEERLVLHQNSKRIIQRNGLYNIIDLIEKE